MSRCPIPFPAPLFALDVRGCRDKQYGQIQATIKRLESADGPVCVRLTFKNQFSTLMENGLTKKGWAQVSLFTNFFRKEDFANDSFKAILSEIAKVVGGAAQPPIRQLLGPADTQTAHPATSSTAPAHQRLGSANVETTPAGAPAAVADRTQRPNATCEGTTG